MASTSTSYSPFAQRPPGHRRGRLSTSLPSYSSTVQEKLARLPQPPSWFITVVVPIPGIWSRRLRLPMLNIRRMHHFSVTRFGRKRGSLLLFLAFLALFFSAFALAKRFGTHEKKWPGPFTSDPPTLVYKREDLHRIWRWEVASGHYPRRRGSESLYYSPCYLDTLRC